jgi:uncharacterized caspase-like protein
MSEDTSLTDAVKRAAGISLTEAVKTVAGRGAWFLDETPDSQRRARRSAAAALPRLFRTACTRFAALAVLTLTFLNAMSTSTAPDGGTQPLASSHRRVALVVGNSAYQQAPALQNPTNDAADMSATLKKLGFHVIEGVDLDKKAFDAILGDFASALSGADVGLFFYAGHGIQVSDQNYLVPIDAALTTVSAVDIEMVRLDLVHQMMKREPSTSLLFFDACRDNPLSRNLARAMGPRSQIGRGLAAVEAGAGTLVSFSTQPGNVALDGVGRNSPFSAALVAQLGASNEDLNTILIAVRNDVMRRTEGKQVPWEHSSLTRRLYLNPTVQSAASRQPGSASDGLVP